MAALFGRWKKSKHNDIGSLTNSILDSARGISKGLRNAITGGHIYVDGVRTPLDDYRPWRWGVVGAFVLAASLSEYGVIAPKINQIKPPPKQRAPNQMTQAEIDSIIFSGQQNYGDMNTGEIPFMTSVSDYRALPINTRLTPEIYDIEIANRLNPTLTTDELNLRGKKPIKDAVPIEPIKPIKPLGEILAQNSRTADNPAVNPTGPTIKISYPLSSSSETFFTSTFTNPDISVGKTSKNPLTPDELPGAKMVSKNGAGRVVYSPVRLSAADGEFYTIPVPYEKDAETANSNSGYVIRIEHKGAQLYTQVVFRNGIEPPVPVNFRIPAKVIDEHNTKEIEVYVGRIRNRIIGNVSGGIAYVPEFVRDQSIKVSLEGVISEEKETPKKNTPPQKQDIQIASAAHTIDALLDTYNKYMPLGQYKFVENTHGLGIDSWEEAKNEIAGYMNSISEKGELGGRIVLARYNRELGDMLINKDGTTFNQAMQIAYLTGNRSLEKIASDLGSEYGMHVSASTISEHTRELREQLGVKSRKDIPKEISQTPKTGSYSPSIDGLVIPPRPATNYHPAPVDSSSTEIQSTGKKGFFRSLKQKIFGKDDTKGEPIELEQIIQLPAPSDNYIASAPTDYKQKTPAKAEIEAYKRFLEAAGNGKSREFREGTQLYNLAMAGMQRVAAESREKEYTQPENGSRKISGGYTRESALIRGRANLFKT